MSKYEKVLYWSEEDSAWIAEVPELPYCAADGPTPEAALQAVEQAIQQWLEIAQEKGWKIPQPQGRVTFA